MAAVVLRDYQERAVNEVRAAITSGKRKVVMVLPTGSGKSIIFAEIIRLAVEKGKKVLWLVHRRNLVTQMKETLSKFEIDAGVIMAGEESNTFEQVQLGTIQTYARRLQLDTPERNQFFINADLVLVDECFTGETKILTPHGEKRIDVVRCGDIVYNQSGVGVVESVFSKPTKEKLFTVEIENGERITCTGDHPFFTEKGWVKAERLVSGTHLFSPKGMSLLWEGYTTENKRSGKHKNKTSDKGEHLRGNMGEAEVLLNIVCEEDGKPNEQQSSSAENEGYTKADKAQAVKARRERAITTLAAACIASRTRGWVGIGGGSTNKNEKSRHWLSDLLQNRHSKQRENDSDRGGREHAHDGCKEGLGRKENRVSFFPRVVSVTCVEPESARTVFNLRVSGHPSYFAGGVAVHNCHRSIAKSYKKIIEIYSEKIIIGCTATPMRADQRGLGEIYEEIVDVVGVKELTEKGHLAKARYFVPAHVELDGIKIVHGDYELKELDKRFNQVKLIGDIVDNWLNIAGNRKTIIFCINVKHSISVSEAFSAKGIPAYHLDAKSSDTEREEAFLRMEKGTIKIITNVALYQEGMDCPDISSVVMARPTKSLGLYRQCCGRGLRPSPEQPDCIIIDHAGVWEQHGNLDEEVCWTLDGKEKAWKMKKKKETEQKTSKCTVCHLVFSGTNKCPDCKSPIITFGKKIETVDADLTEINPKKATMVEKRRFYGMMLYYADERGWNEGAVAHRYKAEFGCWPKGLKDTAPIKPDQNFLNRRKHELIKWAKGKNKGKEKLHKEANL